MYRVPRFLPTRRSVPLQTRRLSTERASVQSIPVLARSRALAAGPSEARFINNRQYPPAGHENPVALSIPG